MGKTSSLGTYSNAFDPKSGWKLRMTIYKVVRLSGNYMFHIIASYNLLYLFILLK